MSPHILFFLFYNLVYLLPVVLVFLWGYAGGGAAEAISMDEATLLKVMGCYVAGFAAFAAGSAFISLLPGARFANALPYRCDQLGVKLSERLFIMLFALVFLAAKIALIPKGVYAEYAFSTGQMEGGIWSFSMFCAEALVLLAAYLLFSGVKHNVLGFGAIVVLNGINLLHGTRIFFMISIMLAVLYAYIRGYLPLRRLLLIGPVLAAGVLGLAYAVFLSRSAVSLEGAFTLANLVSPVVYESLFSQLSLVNLLRAPDMWDALGEPLRFFSDNVVSVTPRVLLPEKDDLQYFNQFTSISPLGAMNGYAAGLIYFGVFFPLFYFVLGVLGSWLQQRAKRSAWWFIVYAYFTADILFRVMRDGYLIPVKMMINTLQLLVLMILVRHLFRLLKGRPSLNAARGEA